MYSRLISIGFICVVTALSPVLWPVDVHNVLSHSGSAVLEVSRCATHKTALSVTVSARLYCSEDTNLSLTKRGPLYDTFVAEMTVESVDSLLQKAKSFRSHVFFLPPHFVQSWTAADLDSVATIVDVFLRGNPSWFVSTEPSPNSKHQLLWLRKLPVTEASIISHIVRLQHTNSNCASNKYIVHADWTSGFSATVRQSADRLQKAFMTGRVYVMAPALRWNYGEQASCATMTLGCYFWNALSSPCDDWAVRRLANMSQLEYAQAELWRPDDAIWITKNSV